MSEYYTPLSPSITSEKADEAVVKAKREGEKVKYEKANPPFTDSFANNVLSVRGTVDGTVYGFDIDLGSDGGKIGTRKVKAKSDCVEVTIKKTSPFNLRLQSMG